MNDRLPTHREPPRVRTSKRKSEVIKAVVDVCQQDIGVALIGRTVWITPSQSPGETANQHQATLARCVQMV